VKAKKIASTKRTDTGRIFVGICECNLDGVRFHRSIVTTTTYSSRSTKYFLVLTPVEVAQSAIVAYSAGRCGGLLFSPMNSLQSAPYCSSITAKRMARYPAWATRLLWSW